jgi:hypothetical protein
MVAEPIGFGVPTLVRRADCGTNHIAPGVVMMDSFAGLRPHDFAALIQAAWARAPQLAAYVADRYALPPVRRLWLEVLREWTPPERQVEFDKAVSDPGSLARLDNLIVY